MSNVVQCKRRSLATPSGTHLHALEAYEGIGVMTVSDFLHTFPEALS
jgi:hypothetical protein